MTPNQQEEMEKELNESFLETYPQFDVFDEDKVTNDSYHQLRSETLDTFSEGFEAAYTLQQGKIDRSKKAFKSNLAEEREHIEELQLMIEKLEKEKIEAIAICKSQFDIVKMERDRLKKFCDEFVYGEENPQYYKTMDEQIESLKSDLKGTTKGLITLCGFREVREFKKISPGACKDLEEIEAKTKEIRQRHNLDKSEEV